MSLEFFRSAENPSELGSRFAKIAWIRHNTGNGVKARIVEIAELLVQTMFACLYMNRISVPGSHVTETLIVRGALSVLLIYVAYLCVHILLEIRRAKSYVLPNGEKVSEQLIDECRRFATELIRSIMLTRLGIEGVVRKFNIAQNLRREIASHGVYNVLCLVSLLLAPCLCVTMNYMEGRKIIESELTGLINMSIVLIVLCLHVVKIYRRSSLEVLLGVIYSEVHYKGKPVEGSKDGTSTPSLPGNKDV